MDKVQTSDRPVKTRFAPSPTGLMHIGQVRTVLYNFLVAKQNKGIFLLRIEDTDRERLVPGSAENILETLKWLGLEWDEGPNYQSERLDIYQEHADQLVKKGLAYEKDKAIWFKTSKEGSTSWSDLVGNKTVTIENAQQDDFVMIKSDRFPTYNFAVVVDDYLMGVTHVIRGVEFISSTPKHIMLYRAFGWDLPQFAHLPLILGLDRSKLSKRHGAKPAWDFKQDGYLKEAMLNYMALLSWTPPGEKEIISLEDMIKNFDLTKVHPNNPVFDLRKLEWMNGEYIRMMSDEQLSKRLQEYLPDHPLKGRIAELVPLIKERITKLSDFVPLTDFIFEKPEYDIKTFQKLNIKNPKAVLEKILEKMQGLKTPWEAQEFEKTFRDLAENLGISVKDMFQLIRVAVSGQLVTPPLFESIEIMGEDETINRVKEAVKIYPNFNG